MDLINVALDPESRQLNRFQVTFIPGNNPLKRKSTHAATLGQYGENSTRQRLSLGTAKTDTLLQNNTDEHEILSDAW